MLPPIRSEWVRQRRGPVVTQMRYARQGIVTEEMEYVAKREGLPADLVRSGCSGRAAPMRATRSRTRRS